MYINIILLISKTISFFYSIVIIISIGVTLFGFGKIESSHIEIHPQTITDGENDWVRLLDGRENRNGHGANDIKELVYFKIDEIIHARLWLKNLTSFNDIPGFPLQYGVQIDSDANRMTGDRGIEYDLTMTWDNESKSWKKQYIQRSSFGDSIILHEEYVNMSDFRKGNTVNIIMNMSHFNLPDKYKMFFYAIAEKPERGAPRTIDFLRWIYVPPPEFKLALEPEKIDQISFNETKRIKVTASSNVDLPAKVQIDVMEEPQARSNLFDLNFINSEESKIIPRYEKYKTYLDVELLEDTIGSSSIMVEANFTLANETYSAHFKNTQAEFSPVFSISSSPSTQRVELPITMKKSPSTLERFVMSVEEFNRVLAPLQIAITAIFSIAGVIIGMIFNNKLKTGIDKMKRALKNKPRLKKGRTLKKNSNEE